MTAHALPGLHEPRRLRNPFVPAQEEVQTAEPLLFSDSALYALLIPIIIEQFLNALMGMADTMMISNLGSAAISAVSLTDSINMLMIQVFAALAAGGTVICSQYLGQKNLEQCNKAGSLRRWRRAERSSARSIWGRRILNSATKQPGSCCSLFWCCQGVSRRFALL